MLKETKNSKHNSTNKKMRLSIRAKIIMMCITIAVVPLFLSCFISVMFHKAENLNHDKQWLRFSALTK